MAIKLRSPIHLIVNADDYAYFPCISRGILDAACAGKLTATGILATSADLKPQLQWLDKVESLDLGVHLNLSYGQPLTGNMSEMLAAWGGNFPSAYVMVFLIMKGSISVKDIYHEWGAQIEACSGHKLWFLNSHEHMHMLPVLFPVVMRLADDFRIPYVRLTRADRQLPDSLPALFRAMLITGMHALNLRRVKISMPIFLGLNGSGKLNIGYLEQVFSRLEPGKCYELMCHPGYFAREQILSDKLRAFHHWEAELALLHSRELQDLYEKYAITVGNYER